MWTRRFWLDVTERTLKTFGQAFAASLVVTGLDDWRGAVAIGAGAGVLAVASSLAGSQIGNKESASALPAREEP